MSEEIFVFPKPEPRFNSPQNRFFLLHSIRPYFVYHVKMQERTKTEQPVDLSVSGLVNDIF